MGVGMVVVVPADQGAAAAAKLQDLGFPASVIGEVVAGQGRCLLE
jgi:phosphoribosylaminoimidazole (AIR) synthetase